MTQIANPQQEDIIYDPACGTGNLLVDAYEYIKKIDPEQPVTSVFQGIDVHSSVIQLCKMNLILHNIKGFRLCERDVTGPTTLNDLFTCPDLFEENYQQEEKRRQVVLTHPLFDTREQQQTPGKAIRKEEASKDYDRGFLEHCMNHLANNGDQCVIIVSQHILLSGNNKDIELKQRLVKDFNIWMIVRLPSNAFDPLISYPTYLLFFQKGGSTDRVLCCSLSESHAPSSKDIDHLLAIWRDWRLSSFENIPKEGNEMHIQIKNRNELIGSDSRYDLTIHTPPQEDHAAMDLQKTLHQLLLNSIDLYGLTQMLRAETTWKENMHGSGE